MRVSTPPVTPGAALAIGVDCLIMQGMNTLRGHATRNRVAATVLVVAALAPACGSSSGTRASDKTTTTATTAATSTAGKGSTTTATSQGGASASSSSAPSGPSDFCSKISDAEAKAVLGVEISRTEPGAGAAQSCIKGTQRQTDLTKSAYVSFSTFPAAGPMASFDKVKGALPGSKAVSGIGDQALYSSSVGAVFAFLGGKVVQVQVVKAGRPAGEADAVTMAKALVARLG